MAASEEELLLLGLFGEDAERLLRNIRGRASADEDELASSTRRAPSASARSCASSRSPGSAR